ncbi:uncharacterized protein PFL1_01880 [Pseudozyma flocculosa PF-1]|uniref:Related to thiamine-phosphate diphosphorylase / hydroxyethylthiazole kinase n=1 Tax=Pseudozyma flocculosa TaxID=84751 RepID=A0A5C3EYR9_9BASI|nr:uncharacterized protein PFL1_01880 [Pseudozyma flocculosa PF-1]EPQ30354.1 hypothetical protein PFL1_01880 [Pseudozyma flocculosa PF-1]SPO37424.1 related to thiamine-phosphate diphosphorylase / hydroxyethylthiazole kinase [Pseudozyma flocculosa]
MSTQPPTRGNAAANDEVPLDRSKLDYSVYLVTGRELLPPGVDFFDSLERSLRDGHVGMVQIREKDAETGHFLEIAKRALDICDKYNVTMLINDNLTVALSLPARVGLHIGQDDIPVAQARRLLGPNRLLGISVKSVQQALDAKRSGADYAGVGPCYGTQSKKGITADKVIGPRGAREIVEVLGAGASGGGSETRMPCVLIGGLNQKTAARTLFGATSSTNAPDGIAVISAIVARVDSDVAARELGEIVSRFKLGLAASRSSSSLPSESGSALLYSAFAPHPSLLPPSSPTDAAFYVDRAASLLSTLRSSPTGPPLIQTITSHVSSTLSANIALAFSASPIMSHEAEEAEELSGAVGGLVLNIGTIGPPSRAGMKVAGAAANRGGKPVVLDPVGCGATNFRKEVVNEILNHTQVTLLKGNAAELSSISGSAEVAARGVDSGSGQLSDPVALVRTLASRERCLVLLSGKTDYLSDGQRVVACDNGHELLGRITGSGCALGVMLAVALASCVHPRVAVDAASPEDGESGGGLGKLMVNHQEDLFVGALMALLSMTIASEQAAARPDVRGPGSFIPALIDEIASISPDDIKKAARIKVVA